LRGSPKKTTGNGKDKWGCYEGDILEARGSCWGGRGPEESLQQAAMLTKTVTGKKKE